MIQVLSTILILSVHTLIKPVSCEHEQKAHSLLIGVAMVVNKRALFVILTGHVHQFEA